ncbi:MAG: F0F1 ATP synthase subunit B' [Epsilonproteobacteria bacterium]|nr:F0F1 ATP synthase subunit B' [Campylobacterota bacterium]
MLDLNPGLMLFVLVIFFSLLYLLNQILYQPLLKFMDDRESSISNRLKSARELEGSSSELNAKADDILAKARAESNAIRESAVKEAKASAESRLAEKSKELEAKYQEFLSGLSREKRELEESLKAQLPLLKQSLNAKIDNL